MAEVVVWMGYAEVVVISGKDARGADMARLREI